MSAIDLLKQVQSALDAASGVMREALARLTDKDTDLCIAKARVEELEAQVVAKDREIDRLSSGVRVTQNAGRA